MTSDVPESTRRYAREHREQLEYILRHGSSIEICAYAAALLIRGLPDPKVQQIIDELKTGQEVLS